MICHLCAAKHPFLSSYAKSALTKVDTPDATSASTANAADSTNVTTATSTNATDDEAYSRKRKLSGKDCRLKRMKQSASNQSGTTEESSSSSSSTALFFSEGWRSTLCNCPNCLKMYEDENITFLTQEEDSVGAYEAAGAAQTGLGGEEEEEAALGNLLGGMDRCGLTCLEEKGI